MHSALNNNLFLVKEHVGLFKAANNFDIYEPQSGEVVLHCREPRLGMLQNYFALLIIRDSHHSRLRLPHHQVNLSVRSIVAFLFFYQLLMFVINRKKKSARLSSTFFLSAVRLLY